MTKTALELLSERNNDGRPALELALDNYELWNKASQALSQNKDYEISNGQNSKRKLSRADANEVSFMLDKYEKEIASLQGNPIDSPRIRTVFTAGYPSA